MCAPVRSHGRHRPFLTCSLPGRVRSAEILFLCRGHPQGIMLLRAPDLKQTEDQGVALPPGTALARGQHGHTQARQTPEPSRLSPSSAL